MIKIRQSPLPSIHYLNETVLTFLHETLPYSPHGKTVTIAMTDPERGKRKLEGERKSERERQREREREWGEREDREGGVRAGESNRVHEKEGER